MPPCSPPRQWLPTDVTIPSYVVLDIQSAPIDATIATTMSGLSGLSGSTSERFAEHLVPPAAMQVTGAQLLYLYVSRSTSFDGEPSMMVTSTFMVAGADAKAIRDQLVVAAEPYTDEEPATGEVTSGDTTTFSARFGFELEIIVAPFLEGHSIIELTQYSLSSPVDVSTPPAFLVADPRVSPLVAAAQANGTIDQWTVTRGLDLFTYFATSVEDSLRNSVSIRVTAPAGTLDDDEWLAGLCGASGLAVPEMTADYGVCTSTDRKVRWQSFISDLSDEIEVTATGGVDLI